MKIYSFYAESGRRIDRYDSKGVVVSMIARLEADAEIKCMYIDRGGVVGYHRAAAPQLFLVFEGEGWVRGESEEKIPIHAGSAAYWDKGEGHESGSHSGMAAFILEAETLESSILMQILDKDLQ